MKLIHTSPTEITKITNSGLFGDCLFFSSNEYSMGSVKAVYEIEIDADKIIAVSALHDESIVEHIAAVFAIDADAAERILDGRDSAYDHGQSAQDDWWIQAKQGECAKMMGYEACEAGDEQGTVYIVPMFGREKDLVRIR